ncbi:MAG: hypothetical protein KDD35_05165 [Bdellovibrionales bacterium]|nr:hypothetical protein [Bdellovibrionales bacterium]
MIYLIGANQDIVVSFVQSLKGVEAKINSKVQIIPLETIESVHLDFDQFICRSIETTSKDTTIFLKASDRIYLRPYSFERALESNRISEDWSHKYGQLYSQLSLARQVVIGNTRLRSDSNNNKLFHSLRYSNFISAPESQLTTELDLRRFAKSVVKSPSYYRTEVVESKAFQSLCLEDIHLPILVQQLISGTALRVTVIGCQDIFTTKIYGGTKVDYRYSDKMVAEPIGLPKSIKKLCLAIAKNYGLPLCGIDLLVKDQNLFFLEVNPEPGWAFVEKSQCLAIWRSILRWISNSQTTDTLFPEVSQRSRKYLKVCVNSLIAPKSYNDFPKSLTPDDYVARPGESHPLWNC